MPRLQNLVILAVFLTAGLISVGYNIYTLWLSENGSSAKFAYFAVGAVVILSGWFIYLFLTRIEQVRADQSKLQDDNLTLKQEMERLRGQQHESPRKSRSPKICRMEKPSELPPLTPEQLNIMQYLFNDDYQIHVKKLSGGYSNHGVFRIIQERERDDELDVSGFVLKYLDVKDVRAEISVHGDGGLFAQYPLPYTPGRLVGSWPAGDEIALAADDMLGAVYYHLTTLEESSQLRTLTDIYNVESFEGIEPYLVGLFDKRLLPWYRQSRGRMVGKPLGGAKGEYERLSNKRGRIQDCISELLSIPRQGLRNIDQIDIPFLPEPWGKQTFHNPVSWILKVLDPGTADCFRATCHYSPVHGDLHTGNILVEQGRRTNIWLIDFPHAHFGPALLDFATLEADMKYNLLSEDHCSMEEWLRFEKRLMAPLERSRQIAFLAPWHEDWTPENQHLCNAWRIIGFLRERVISSSFMGADVRAYYLALLHATLPVVYKQHTDFQKQCALVSSAWMCEYLGS
jgi:hypothetical protein